MLFFYLRLCLSCDFPFMFSNQIIVWKFNLMRVTCPAHLIHFGFITLTILGEAYKLLIMGSSPVSSYFLLCPNILLRTMFLFTLNLCNFLPLSYLVMWRHFRCEPLSLDSPHGGKIQYSSDIRGWWTDLTKPPISEYTERYFIYWDLMGQIFLCKICVFYSNGKLVLK
jgi:hypothetical protein